MIAWNKGRVVAEHEAFGGVERFGLPAQAGSPSLVPEPKGWICQEQRIGERLCAQIAKRVCKIGPVGVHEAEEIVDERSVCRFFIAQAELASHAFEPVVLKMLAEASHGIRGLLHGQRLVVVQQRQQRFGQPGQIPLRDVRLVAVGVAAVLVDGAKYCGRIIGI